MNDSVLDFKSDGLLDNPIWSSLATRHAHLAIGGVGIVARRYPADIGPLSAVQAANFRAFADLAAIVPKSDVAVLFLENSVEGPRAGNCFAMERLFRWSVLPFQISHLRRRDFTDVVCRFSRNADAGEPHRAWAIPQQYSQPRGVVGIRVDGRLAAMAGKRLSPTGFAEVSAVCTHPDFRGRGYAQALVAAVTRNIHSEGRTPFLTSFEANTAAIRIYQQVGFVHRRTFQLAVLKPPSPSHEPL